MGNAGRAGESSGVVMLLKIPDIRMETSHDCGRAAARCVLAFHGIVTHVTLSSPTDGTDPRELESLFRRMGLHVVSGEMSVADVDWFCGQGKRKGRPVICLVHWPGDEASHYVVARGVSKGKMWLHDTESGPRSVQLDKWCEAWQAKDGRMSERWRCWGIAAWPE